MPIISIELSDELLERLDDYAEKEDRKRSDVLRQILKEKLD
jgi:metal-responsive CopG/Arc/MetJ family transcriptional regulator